ncbi:MAG: 30S ribosomal protein S6 [Patescibacteria group bacterium]
MEKEQKNYEIGFLTRTEDDKNEIIKVLEGQKASIAKSGSLSRIKLAYPIQKEPSAYFDYFIFSALPEAIEKISQSLKLNLKILRFLIVTPPAIGIQKPAPRFRKAVLPKPVVKKPAVEKIPLQQVSNEMLEKKLEEILK